MMGRLVVKQPNGLLAVFSTVVNDFIITDAFEDELADELSQIIGKKYLDAMIRDGIEDRPVPTWILFTVAPVHDDGLNRWRYCLAVIRNVHGGGQANRVARTVGAKGADKP